MSEAYLYEAIRTPRGRGQPDGSLHSVKPISLVTGLMRELQARHQIDTALIDDVLLGCVTPVGDQGANIARIAALAAGWDGKVAGVQLNRFGASGLEAVNLAAQKVRSGWDDLVVAGGVESMSRVPPGADGGAWSLDPETSLLTGYVPPGISADLIATLDDCQREQLDAYALRSQQRAAAARAGGRFRAVVPVRDQNGVLVLAEDECLKPSTSLEALASLKPLFDARGESGFDSAALRQHPRLERLRHLHTAGNAGVNADGAALTLIGSKAAGSRLGLEPRARIVAAAVTGADPLLMVAGAVVATRQALKKAGLPINSISLFEVHESFAAVVLRFLRELDIAEDKVNVNGGAIALGDAAGATGCMLVSTLLDELEARRLRYGLAAMGVGGGIGIATIVERL
ncbi:acetyl-CoA C-acetyltransferase [Duganella sp. FT109W]|uniref:Acetyl-CoA C-acetyltransferase n=1 Tax=Duganella margarita TaxID=2692170 RepID=A0A7X4H3E4_9BURK|nr:acetyl-CoA C-acetyltransferase [Duganella margarita]MYM73562.1 acetyl-CoA C-acetyltransferase [Duganella margarita]MYN40303.1 acetyl-CoA C-acetyltransferase [Duganella margarita]